MLQPALNLNPEMIPLRLRSLSSHLHQAGQGQGRTGVNSSRPGVPSAPTLPWPDHCYSDIPVCYLGLSLTLATCNTYPYDRRVERKDACIYSDPCSTYTHINIKHMNIKLV